MACLYHGSDARLYEVVGQAGEHVAGFAVGAVLFERRNEKTKGALGLAIRQHMGLVLPLDHHPEATPIVVVECEECGVDAGEMRRASVSEGEQDAQDERAHAQLARPDPEGQERLEGHGDTRLVDDGLEGGERGRCRHDALAPNNDTASRSVGVATVATRSPRRCEHTMPAAS